MLELNNLNASNGKLNNNQLNSNHHVHFQSTGSSPLTLASTSTSSSSSSKSFKIENNVKPTTLQPNPFQQEKRLSLINNQDIINRNSILGHRGSSISTPSQFHPKELSLFHSCCDPNFDHNDSLSEGAISASYFDNELSKKQVAKIWCKRIFRFTLCLLLCTSVSGSWLTMTLLLTKVINDVNSNQTLLNSKMDLAGILSCNYCFFLVWLTTSCLIFIYPIYFLLHIFIFRYTDSESKDKYLTKLEIFKISLKIFDDRSSISMNLLTSSSSSKRSSFGATNTSNSQATITSNNNNSTANNNVNYKITSKYLRIYFLKIAAISLVWVLTGYSYLKAIDLIKFSDVVMIFAANSVWHYMAKWVILHSQFYGVKVRENKK